MEGQMMGDIIKPSAFDPSRFKINPNKQTGGEVRNFLTHVPVRKPSKQQFVRVHPSPEYRLNCAILKMEDDDRPFLVVPEMHKALGEEIKYVDLRLAIDRQGNFFLWPVPPTQNTGSENTWNVTQRDIANKAEHLWMRMISNQAISSYFGKEAEGGIPEPHWGSDTMEYYLKIAFGGEHIIETEDHPVIDKLRGF